MTREILPQPITNIQDHHETDHQNIQAVLTIEQIMTPRSDFLCCSAADRISDEELIASIFLPGFSTAETVTDISGRGVGMDIVKSSIEALSGTIEVDSTPGMGTEFTLKLPLTLAIIGSLLIRIGDIVFAIPKDDVREIVSVHKSEILTVHGKQTFEVRGQYIPLVGIEQLFDWGHLGISRIDKVSTTNATEVAILQSDGQPFGLQIDQSIGSQDVVIKSLAENFVGIQGLAGASILGDGKVALMLDVATLQKMATRRRARDDRGGGPTR